MRVQTRTNVVCWRLYPIEHRSQITDPLGFRSSLDAEMYLDPEDLKRRLSYVELAALARAQMLFSGLTQGDLSVQQEAWFRLLGDQRGFRKTIPAQFYTIGTSWGKYKDQPFGTQTARISGAEERSVSPSASDPARSTRLIAREQESYEMPSAPLVHEEASPLARQILVIPDEASEAVEIKGGERWTAAQRQVISARAASRLLVDAGPGTGKTATACARIAWLVTHGRLEASEILLVSFTRTAVHELRNRIASHLETPADVAALRIATIDSHAWAIQSGFDSDSALTGSFEDNIKRVIELVKQHEGVFEYLGTIRHLVVDEAQDVIGARCELLLEIINALPAATGVSIFADDAQAIYGFSRGVGDSAIEGTLPESVREFLSDQFSENSLDEVHRTADPKLLQIFTQGRELLRSDLDGGEQRKAVVALIKQTNHGVLGPYWEDVQQMAAGSSDSLLLFRTRGTALAASSNMGTRPHRLRMSGLPACIDGWIAELLWDWTKPDLDSSDFERLWHERLGSSGDGRAHAAWTGLLKAFGRGSARISVTKLVQRLASGSPPFELTSPEYGFTGPIISTIHASKGREAAEVRLFLTKPSSRNDGDEDLYEEARVAFVGATRARVSLHVGESSHFARSLPSGRAFTLGRSRQEAKAHVEIGRNQDFDPLGLAGRSLYPTAEDAIAAQARIMASKVAVRSAKAQPGSESLEWRYRVIDDESDQHLCYLSRVVNNDLFAIAKLLGRSKPQGYLGHLRIFGSRTLAISADNPLRQQLHAPWRDSGLLSAPMLIGYSMTFFR